MKNKRVIFFVSMLFLVSLTDTVLEGVDTGEIDKVRNKGVLDNGDLEIIDNFVAEAVEELVQSRDFTSISKARSIILLRKSPSKQSAAAQYSEQFSESAYKHISEAFEEAKRITPEDQRFKVILNLLILVDGLEYLRLADLGLDWLNDENSVIRYWAVHSVTNAGFIKQLNSSEGSNLKLAERIGEKLKGLVDSSGPEILGLMAEFAASVEVPEGEDLLLDIADVRISRYADWTVEFELLDGTILRLLDSKIPLGSSSNPAIARRFGQLYSYAIQRYVKGRDFLSATAKEQLASVLVETEQTCIVSRLGEGQSKIKEAIEADDYESLLEEHNKLLGEATRAGQLPLKLNFDYGKTADGERRISPQSLPEPPETQTNDEE
jgi:hypothetical protein